MIDRFSYKDIIKPKISTQFILVKTIHIYKMI